MLFLTPQRPHITKYFLYTHIYLTKPPTLHSSFDSFVPTQLLVKPDTRDHGLLLLFFPFYFFGDAMKWCFTFFFSMYSCIRFSFWKVNHDDDDMKNIIIIRGGKEQQNKTKLICVNCVHTRNRQKLHWYDDDEDDGTYVEIVCIMSLAWVAFSCTNTRKVHKGSMYSGEL